MLRIIRIALALVCFLAITMLFLDFTGVAATDWGWLVRYQVMPALLGLNFVAVAVLVLLTLCFGRVYCSVLCPLGVMQDIAARIRIWVSGRRKRKIGVYKWHAAHKAVRYTIFVLFIVFVVLGLFNVLATSIAALIEPYGEYGRIATGLFSPLYDAGNNMLAEWDAGRGGYTFYTVSRTVIPAISIIGGVTFVVVALFAVFTGRGYCNTICPVGTLLGFLSRRSLMRVKIDTDRCNGCQSCSRHCKSECINPREHFIDYSRCVACMDCIDRCSQNAISYGVVSPLVAQPSHMHREKSGKPVAAKTPVKPAVKSTVRHGDAPKTTDNGAAGADKGRRNFLTVVGVMAGAAAVYATDKVTDGGFAPQKTRKIPARSTKIIPPGAVSASHLSQHCVGCQLCVQACPNGIIRTSTEADSFMQPYIDFSNGYCTPECTRCSDVCPAGAIHPLDEALKSSTKMGTAVVDLETCLAAHNGMECGNCERHCPAGAITLVHPDGGRKAIPVVDDRLCVGCGACEYHCPVGTMEFMKADYPAIHVEGLSVQRKI